MVIYLPGVQPTVLSVMEQGSWSLVVWSSMGNTPMSCMNCKLASGNGRDSNQRHLAQASHLAQDLVRIVSAAPGASSLQNMALKVAEHMLNI